VPASPAAPTPVDPEFAKALARTREIEGELVTTLEKVRSATVTVANLRRVKKDASVTVIGFGSGLLLSQKGTWVITNVHVIKDAEELEVITSDGVHRPVKVADQVEQYDMALLEFTGGPPRGLKGVSIRPNPSLAEGTWVVATGNPFYLALDGKSVATLGVVSGTDRILGSDYLYGKAIQHDAEVNPGNSGGPLWGLDGTFLGINGMIAFTHAVGSGPQNTGVSFSIPAEQVLKYLDAMVDKKKDAQAGYLGLETETSSDASGNPVGALVLKVQRDVTTLKSGDVILKVGAKGKPSQAVRTASDLTNVLSLFPAGSVLRVTYRRGKQTETWEGILPAR
jgi:serine protease Do